MNRIFVKKNWNEVKKMNIIAASIHTNAKL